MPDIVNTELLKNVPLTVSVQSQPVPYQVNQDAAQLGLDATQGHKRSYQQAITSALNATQGHKLSY